MTTTTMKAPMTVRPAARRWLLYGIAGVLLVGAMALDTRVVVIGSTADQRLETFSPDAFASGQFPKIAEWVEAHAADATDLAHGLASDRDATVAKHGHPGSIGPELAVRFTGTFGEPQRGLYPVAVPGLPDGQRIRVQMGPAINGTDLRDVTGTIDFGQFRNQIEYQDAGAALNREMKRQVLAPLGAGPFTGRTLAVTGVFQMVNPNSWLVTPVEVKTP